MTPIKDPDLYGRMAEPYVDRAEAEKAVEAFLERVQVLREECRIPELVVVAAVHMTPGEHGVTSAIGSVARGSSQNIAQLGAYAYRRYTVPTIQAAKQLADLANGADEDES